MIQNTKGLTLVTTQHFLKTVLAKNFNPEKILATFANPRKITEVRAHPGQVRLIGNGLAIVGSVHGGEFHAVTIYSDRALTAPREDQMRTEEGRRYAERFARGLGRG